MNIALIRTMDSQGRIVIPAEIRKQMKLSDGDALELENVGMELLLRKCPTHLNGKEEISLPPPLLPTCQTHSLCPEVSLQSLSPTVLSPYPVLPEYIPP